MKAEIGIVVPIYKVEAYMHRCVDSILSQSYKSFVLVLVDDGSPDRCGEFCDAYALQDSRIHVIHQRNAGLSAARNAAIDYLLMNTNVQWLTFVDSDDWVHSEFLTKLLSAAQRQDVLISSCGFHETSGEDMIFQSPSEVRCWKPKDFYLQHFTNATIACAKLYHVSCFAAVRYPVGKVHEDEFVTYRLLFAQERIAVTLEPLYFYYINPKGITKGTWTPKRLDAWEAYEQQLLFFKSSKDQELIRFCVRGYLENALRQFQDAQALPVSKKMGLTAWYMKQKIRWIIRQCWKYDSIEFWPDFEMLLFFYPFLTRVYRFWIDK